MYLKKLHHFDIDCNRLYEEWLSVTQSLDSLKDEYMPFYNRINVTYSSLQDKSDIIVETGQRQHFPNDSFSLDNIIDAFKSSYTEQVLKNINVWFNDRGLRITKAKYAALEAHKVVGTHTDRDYKIRYHVPIRTSDRCTMTINGIKHVIDEPGSIYSMPGTLPHSAENMSDHLRLLLSLDVIKI